MAMVAGMNSLIRRLMYRWRNMEGGWRNSVTRCRSMENRPTMQKLILCNILFEKLGKWSQRRDYFLGFVKLRIWLHILVQFPVFTTSNTQMQLSLRKH